MLKQVPAFLAIPLSDISLQPEKATRLRLNRQGPIDPYQNPGDGLLNGLPDFSDHPAAKFLGQPLEVLIKGRRGELNNPPVSYSRPVGLHQPSTPRRVHASIRPSHSRTLRRGLRLKSNGREWYASATAIGSGSGRGS